MEQVFYVMLMRLAARSLPRSLAALCAGLMALAVATRAPALSALPFGNDFERQVEETFFEPSEAEQRGAVSRDKVEAFRRILRVRRDEVMAVYYRQAIGAGASEASARKRSARKKRVELYDLLIGGPRPAVGSAGEGWLDRLLAEADPIAARILAGHIIEMDFALKVTGAYPQSLALPENLASISVRSWVIRGATRARDAEREASNLMDPESGLFLEPEDLRAWIQQDRDISRLNPPQDSTIWRNPGAIAEVPIRENLYGGGAPIHHGKELYFPKAEGELESIKKSQTKPKFEIEVESGNDDFSYKLKVGGETHSEPVTGALLAALGFNADVTQHVKNFRMYLGDTSANEIRDQWRSYFEFKRLHLSYRFDDYFERGEDEQGVYLLAKEASLTAKPKEVVRVGAWPWGGNGNDGLREVRALGIFSIWVANTDVKEAENNKLLLWQGPNGEQEVHHLLHDAGHSFGRVISEQPDAFPWDIGRRSLTGKIRFNYHSTWNPSLRSRRLISYADARWAGRLIAQLTRAQITEAVNLGVWPEPVAALLVEKLIHRRNQLVELLELEGEETESGPIEMLPVDRKLSTPDGRVVDGELIDGVFEGSTQAFDDYWDQFVGPVWDAAKLAGAGVFQSSVGLVGGLIFDSDSVGLPKTMVLDVLIELKREIEENPRPTNAGDYYLVRDRVLLGLRVGGGLIATGTTTHYRAYTLVQPAGTQRDATYAGDTILNVRLPFHVWKDELPEEFVLIRESFADVAGNLTTQGLGGQVPPLGAEASLGLQRIRRDVLSRKRGRTLAYRDLIKQSESQFEAFVNALFLRLPFYNQRAAAGKLEGHFYELPAADSPARDGDSAWDDAISRLIRDGDFSGIDQRVPAVEIASKFREQQGWFRIPYFVQRTQSSRSERIQRSEANSDSHEPERFVQMSRSTGAKWNFLDWGEVQLHTLTSVAEELGDDEAEPQLQPPAIVSTYFKRDRDTHDDELQDAYLTFINQVGRAHGQLIEFTPRLHTRNQRWGDLEVALRVGYSAAAVEQLARIPDDALWSAIGAELELTPEELSRHRRFLAERGKWQRHRENRVPSRVRAALKQGRRTAQALREARASQDDRARLHALIRALASASPPRGGWFGGSVLAAIHSLLDPEALSIDAVIQPPPWIENRLVGSVPLSAKTRAEPYGLPRALLNLQPRCAPGLYEMLETLASEVDPSRYGSGCQDARGRFR